MYKNTNWNAVFQSVTDTWLPVICTVSVIIAAAIVIHIIKKYRR